MQTPKESAGEQQEDGIPLPSWYDTGPDAQIRRAIEDGRYHRGFRPAETGVDVQSHSHACAWSCHAVIRGTTAKDILDERRRAGDAVPPSRERPAKKPPARKPIIAVNSQGAVIPQPAKAKEDPEQPAVLPLFAHIVLTHSRNLMMMGAGINRTMPLCKKLEAAAGSAERFAILAKVCGDLAVMVTNAIVNELVARSMLDAHHAEEIRRAIR